jgi:methyl-accepting chemotaxis protein
MAKNKNGNTGKRRISVTIKTLVPIVAVIVMLLFMTLFSIFMMQTLKARLNVLEDETIQVLKITEQMRYDVMHTAEIFADISAGREEEGFAEAEEIKASFYADIEGVKALEAVNASYWEGIKSRYDDYYALSEKMAHTYISSGVDAGNEIMEQVDPITEELSNMVDGAAHDTEAATSRSIADILVRTNMIANVVTLLSFISTVLVFMVGWIVCTKVVHPLQKVSASLVNLADKDLTVEEMTTKQNDEIGDLITAYNDLRGSLRDIMGSLSDASDNLDENSTLMADHSDTILQNVTEMTEAINNITVGAGTQATDIESSMTEIDGLKDIAKQNAVTSEKLSEASAQISEASKHGNKVLDGLYAVTKESEEAFSEIFTSIDKIRNSTGKIAEASNMIESIASQTNLLSLNASIEAARAGEMGKGFAVVADEIRKLSDESTESVNEINRMLEELQENVEFAGNQSQSVKEAVEKQVRGVEETRDSYKDIADNLTTINEEIDNLSHVSKSMTSSCESVGASMESLASSAEENAASTEETNASIEEVLSMMEQINQGAKDLKNRSDDLESIVKSYQL